MNKNNNNNQEKIKARKPIEADEIKPNSVNKLRD